MEENKSGKERGHMEKAHTKVTKNVYLKDPLKNFKHLCDWADLHKVID